MTIPGAPVPFARPRFGGGRVYQAPDYARWRTGAALVLRAARLPPIVAGPVSVSIVAVHPRPATRPSWCSREVWTTGGRCSAVTRMDLDNVAKAVLDAATDAGLWTDDRQVACIFAASVYAAVGESPHVEVEVTPFS